MAEQAPDRRSNENGEQNYPDLYAELKKVASRFIRHERSGHTLQTTALVHEAWMRMARNDNYCGLDERNFFAAAASMMRRILIDHARKKKSQKRGGGAMRVLIDENQIQNDEAGVDVLELDEVLRKLAQLNSRHAQIVELRFFGGMTIEDTAAALNVSDFTVKNDWRAAKAWLLSELGTS